VSQEKAQEFIYKIGTEKRFSSMIDELKSRDDLLLAARSLGYDFTADEFRMAVVRIMDLGETELDTVTGGAVIFAHGKNLPLLSLLSVINAG
jgi:predicted ribosomally synthesized peptide with nif11-like leader